MLASTYASLLELAPFPVGVETSWKITFSPLHLISPQGSAFLNDFNPEEYDPFRRKEVSINVEDKREKKAKRKERKCTREKREGKNTHSNNNINKNEKNILKIFDGFGGDSLDDPLHLQQRVGILF